MATIFGSVGADSLTGTTSNDVIHGGPNGFMDTDTGADTLRGENGNDALFGYGGNDSLFGGAGNDSLYAGTGANVVDGGAGNDVAEFDFSDRSLAVSFLNGGVAGTVYGASVGGVAAGSIVDVESLGVIGGSAGDTIGGVYSVFSDIAVLTGGGGTDIAVVDASSLTATALGGGLNYSGIFDNAGNRLVALNVEALHFTGNATSAGYGGITGGAGNDRLVGLGGNDTFYGETGNDSIDGAAGNDNLTGGEGNDSLFGGAGNDSLYAGTGANLVDGGAGNDVAEFDFSDRSLAVSFLNGGVAGTVYGASVGGVAAGSIVNVESLGVIGGSAGDTIGGVYSVFSTGAALTGGGGIDIAVVNASSLTATALGGGLNYGGIFDNASQQLVALNVEALHFTGNATSAGYGGITGGTGNDRLVGLAGNDTFNGSTGNDSIDGAAGDDSLTGAEGNDSLTGGSGNDSLYAGTGVNLVDGGAGTDFAEFDFSDRSLAVSFLNGGVAGTVYGASVGGVAAGSIVNVESLGVSGGSAGDTIGGVYAVFSDNAVLTGGEGTDIAVVDASSLTTTALGGGVVNYGEIYDSVGRRLVVLNVEALHFTGNATNANYGGLYGGTGNDRLIGLAGNDSFYGETGNDSIDGAAGNDSLIGGQGNDTLLGGEGSDYLEAGTGVNAVDGGAGNDVATFDFSDRTVAVSFLYSGVAAALQTATAGGVAAGTAINVETFGITGGSAGDTIGGVYAVFSDHAVLNGGEGTDIAVVDTSSLTTTALGGGASFGAIYDNAGNRLVALNVEALHFTGNATNAGYGGITGGTGNDRLIGLAGNDTFNGDAGNDSIDGAAGHDSLLGGEGNDSLTGGIGNDTMAGDAGNDSLLGGDGNNSLSGGTGNDTLTAGTGSDTLEGGTGVNVIDGGAGTDVATFDFSDRNVAVSFLYSGVATALQTATAGGVAAGTAINVETFGITGGSAGDTIGGVYAVFSDAAGLAGGEGIDVAVVDASSLTTTALYGGNIYGGIYDDAFRRLVALNVEALHFTGNATFTSFGGIVGGIGDDRLIGLAGNDFFSGDTGNDSIDGAAGNDSLVGGGGNDSVTGGTGNDSLTGGTGNDSLTGGDGNDTLQGEDGNDTLNGGTGSDTLEGGTGNNVIDGGAGNDVATFDFSDRNVAINFLYSGVASALQTATAGGVAAGTAINVETFGITGGSADDTIGGVYSVFSDVAVLAGGGGTNVAVVDASSLTTTAFSGGVYWGVIADNAGQQLVRLSVEALYFTGNATGTYVGGITGGTGNDRLIGLAGNDTFDGWTGNDSIDGAAGNDNLTGGEGNDSLTGGIGNDTLAAGTGNDTLSGDGGNDSLNGEGGIDTASYASSTLGVRVSLAVTTGQNTGGAGTDTLVAIENLIGGSDADTLTGSTAANLLAGGDGDDVLQGGLGNDTLDGGAGNDTASFSSSTAAIILSLANPAAQNTGAGTDSLIGIEHVTGGSAADSITGSDLANRLEGGLGNDTLSGGGGADTVLGGAGNDSLDGGADGDTLSYAGLTTSVSVSLAISGAQNTGGGGTDTAVNFENLTGGEGADSLVGDGLANTLDGGTGNDTLLGAGGADTLVGGLGSDNLNGGADADLVTYGFAVTAPVWTVNGDGSVSIAKPAGTDVLREVEVVRFLNGDYTFATNQFVNATLSIAALAADKAEGDAGSTPFTFTVTRAGDLSMAHSATWTLAGDVTAEDFAGGALPTGTVSFAAGETSKTITLNVAGELLTELDESLTITLSNGSFGTAFAVPTATGTIRNDDTTLDLAGPVAPIAEGNAGSTAFVFTVTRSGDLSEAASAAYAVGGASAADFVGGALPSGTVSFAAGEASKSISVAVVGDTMVEPDETFILTLSSASGATLGTAAASATIRNDDSTLSIAGPLAPIKEGDAGNTAFLFTVTRAGDTSGAASVAYAVTPSGTGTAAASAADFTGNALPSGTVNFAAGETSKTITINVLGDTVVEAQEGFTVTLSTPTGALLDIASATAAIANDDAALALSASAAQVTEGNAGSTPFTYTVTRTGDLTEVSSVGWSAAATGTSPAAASDFTGNRLPSGSLSFAAGESVKTFTVNIAGDTLVETNETFLMRLGSPVNAVLLSGQSSLTTTIVNDDTTQSTLAITGPAAPVAEGDSGSTAMTFIVTRSGSTTGATTVNYAVTGSGGAPASATDFTGDALPTGTVSFAAGETSKTITIDVAGELLTELDESFTVTLSNGSSGTVVAVPAATGTIRNDDTTLDLAGPAAPIAEGNAGSTEFVFTVTRSGDLSEATSAAYAVTGANAADFVGGALPSGTVSFAAGEASKTISVAVLGDTMAEADETFTLTLSDASGATLGTAAASATISNDDSSLSIAGPLAPITEGDASNKGFFFTVTRAGDTGGAASVAYAVTPSGTGTAAASAADFSGNALPSATVSFAAGETSRTITILVVGDTVVEAQEGFTVTLSNPTGARLDTASATAFIANDDSALALSASAAQVTEGNAGSTPFTYTVTRTGDLTEVSNVNWSAAATGTSPAAASDFTGNRLPGGTLSFAAGESVKTFTVNIAGDTLVETNETFLMRLGSPVNAVLLSGQSSLTTTIVNDDTTLAIAGPAAPVAEGDSGSTAMTFTVTRSGSTTGATTVNYAVTGSGGAPASATDFAAGALPSGLVSFAAGETSKTITINIAGDVEVEPNEGFTVTLSAPVGATLATAAATATIANDDTAIALADQTLVLAEGTGAGTIVSVTLNRTGDLTGQATVLLTVAGSGATPANAADFVGGLPVPATVTFADGEASRTVVLTIAGDAVREADETFAVTLSDATNATLGTALLSVTLTNDDTAGTEAADSLTGGVGPDLIQGLGGRDTLIGGEGADTIQGGLGADRLTGGAGADIFVYGAIAESTPALSGRDTIVDFSGADGDRIDLSAIDADILVGGDQAFTLIEGDFTGEIGGELSVARFGSSYRVRLDVDGDGDEDAAITVISAQPLTASDFVL